MLRILHDLVYKKQRKKTNHNNIRSSVIFIAVRPDNPGRRRHSRPTSNQPINKGLSTNATN